MDYGLGLLKNEITVYDYFKKNCEVNRVIQKPLFYDEQYFTFVIYEYVDLPTLDEVAKNESTTQESLKFIVKQLIQILDKLYAANMVYRDLKLDNIFVRSDYSIVLIDFMFTVSSNKKLGLLELDLKKGSSLRILKNMGVISQKKRYHWDDAYGLKVLLKDLNQSSKYELNKVIDETSNRVGRLEYYLDHT